MNLPEISATMPLWHYDNKGSIRDYGYEVRVLGWFQHVH